MGNSHPPCQKSRLLGKSYLGNAGSGRRRARNAEGVRRFKFGRGIFERREPRDWYRHLHRNLHHRLRGRCMRHLASLAALLVVGVSMPVHSRMEAQEAHREDESYAQ